MRIYRKTPTRLELRGIPGGRLWMLAGVGIGAALNAAFCYFAFVIHRENNGIDWAHLPLGVGILIAQAVLWVCAITLAVGRLRLILDRGKNSGEYLVRSPIVEAGKPCRFKLSNIDSLSIETTVESRSGGSNAGPTEATVHRLRLRITHPRRAIVLDETQNDRVERLEQLAADVGEFLGQELVRVGHRD